MKSLLTKIVILDDDNFDSSVCVLLFKRLLHGIEFDIRGFTDPRQGLQYIETEYANHPIPTLLLLDISMPHLNGWQVLHRLEQLPPEITRYLSVFILSHSVAKDDVQKSEASPLVKAYLAKPLTDHLAYLLENILEAELAIIEDRTSGFHNGRKKG